MRLAAHCFVLFDDQVHFDVIHSFYFSKPLKLWMNEQNYGNVRHTRFAHYYCVIFSVGLFSCYFFLFFFSFRLFVCFVSSRWRRVFLSFSLALLLLSQYQVFVFLWITIIKNCPKFCRGIIKISAFARRKLFKSLPFKVLY